ncbi:hypothetical protein WN51_11069 [Melipona quadrifasciata]|uniref:Uncharacterized protein n=1 Tax=Melipona quadrifasciata TaxID=166423 RepID=A0A0N0BHZ7_9HYME|nr:hypothetical protein WN51_11069 [Melipona quadrifasciata]
MALPPSCTIVEMLPRRFSREPRPIGLQICSLRRVEPGHPRSKRVCRRRRTLDAVWRLEISAYTGFWIKGKDVNPAAMAEKTLAGWMTGTRGWFHPSRTNIHARNPSKSVCISAQVTDSESRDGAQTKKRLVQKGWYTQQAERNAQRERERERERKLPLWKLGRGLVSSATRVSQPGRLTENAFAYPFIAKYSKDISTE